MTVKALSIGLKGLEGYLVGRGKDKAGGRIDGDCWIAGCLSKRI